MGESYQATMPDAQVAFKVTVAPEQILMALTDTPVGVEGCKVTLTKLVATLLLLHVPISQAA